MAGLMDPIARHAQAGSGQAALVAPTRAWTFAEMDAAVARRHAWLREQDVEAGDRVALQAERSASTVFLLWALWRAGAVAVPISTREPAARVVRQAQRVGASLLVASADAVHRAAEGEGMPVRSVPEGGAGDGPRPASSGQPAERPATIIYTSGSTGPPKAALHTWANHLYNAKGANANMPLRAGDRWLLSLPLYHVGGIAILVRCAIAGAAVVVPHPDASLAATVDTGITHVSLVSTQFRRLLQASETPPASLRAVLLGGGPLPDALLRAGTAHGWPLHTTYGCTEMASQVTTTPPGASADTLRTAGCRLPHRRLRIDDGQIWVSGPPLFAGYVTADGIDDPRVDGWYPTGDRGWIDAQGQLHVEGRMDRMFVSGGENIQPEEIEAALERLDGVSRAAVVPVPDAEFGERPVAFVRTRDAIDAAALRTALRDTLPGFKVPDAFHPLPADATSGQLKLDREALRQTARKLHE